MKNSILQKLKNGLIEVVFTKTNGECRVMHCTLKETHIPAEQLVTSDKPKKLSEDIIRVWDVDANGWRSFRHDSVINFSSYHE